MMHPVGPLPPGVYWRRRLLLLGAVVVFLVLMTQIASALGTGSSSAAAPAKTSSDAPPATPRGVPSTPARVRTPSGSASTVELPNGTPRSPRSTGPTEFAHSSAPAPGASTPAPGALSSSAAPPPACTSSQLRVAAVTDQSSYQVGDQPVVMLEATNGGRAPCVESFGNSNVELRIYNGEARIWGSNDCPAGGSGSVSQVMAPGVPVRVRMVWSGTTSQPGCAGTRQQVNAGTYTLYASLDGQNGAAAQFSLH